MLTNPICNKIEIIVPRVIDFLHWMGKREGVRFDFVALSRKIICVTFKNLNHHLSI